MKKYYIILKHKISHFIRLRLLDKLLLIEAGLLLILLRVILAFIPLNKFYPLLIKFILKPIYSHKDHLNYTTKVIWAVEACGRYILKRKCLAQALAVHILLNKKRIKNDLQIGFIKNRNTYSAHAWINSEDEILTGDNQRLHLYFKIPLKEANYTLIN